MKTIATVSYSFLLVSLSFQSLFLHLAQLGIENVVLCNVEPSICRLSIFYKFMGIHLQRKPRNSHDTPKVVTDLHYN